MFVTTLFNIFNSDNNNSDCNSDILVDMNKLYHC